MANKVLRKVTHCVFDMDGLLLDTERIYEEVTRQIAASFGRPYPVDVRFRVMGTTEQRSAEIAITECQLPITTNDFLKRYSQMCHERLNNVPLLEGAERLLRHLHANKIPFCLATSSGADMVELKTAQHRELFGLFNHKVCGSTDKEVVNGKPAPDIFLVAAARFGVPPKASDCLVFEDSPNGVTAANSAGMQVVMVPDPRLSQEKTSHATQVLGSLADFKPEQFGLPAFTD
ncbi:probable pseudouridine-5'-phosphatase isoform X1 [Drosophila teissieri]|uniref:probable pseudouridine-5'-phosphatase isoform X1 n=1 Tax=Drosophila teissieri TaxID=7243 RepID=UPI001CB9EDCF|nr:probable pseudouridine-5'-phosphatase isoform X1 [Drosophila teissieri]XP_043640665.1 probable pseudouridine-5'-phosphatase isoform X1 [Drosophila teissieri]